MIRLRPGPLRQALDGRLDRMAGERIVSRIRQHDPTVWTDDPAAPELADRLGWTDLPAAMWEHVDDLTAFADEARARFDRVVLCGMGGSSLAPEVLRATFGSRDGYPDLQLLDSTHPAAVRATPTSALFVIASKSGTTLETRSLARYFWEATGRDRSQFVAITDPGTPLAETAAREGYARVFLNPPDVGGRFSALSLFGLVPAALLGIDLARLLDAARGDAFTEYARLGALIGEAARAGRDKLTVFLSASLAAFGLWLEQLVAESTGKRERGILPVIGETSRAPADHADDRLFVRMTVDGDPDRGARGATDGLAASNHPVADIELADRYGVAAAFLGWEVATAVMGYVLEVNPFDQPNVAESKANTARALAEATRLDATADAVALETWLNGVGQGDYVAVMAYLPPGSDHDRRLATVRERLARRLGTVVTVGYGPRYLHSTGQFHKGGPQRGHFLQVVDRGAEPLPIPGESYGFEGLIRAQADGDLLALQARGRPVVRVGALDVLERELAG